MSARPQETELGFKNLRELQHLRGKKYEAETASHGLLTHSHMLPKIARKTLRARQVQAQ